MNPSERLREIIKELDSDLRSRHWTHDCYAECTEDRYKMIGEVLISETQRAREEAIRECAKLLARNGIFRSDIHNAHEEILSLLSPKESEKEPKP